MLRKPRQFWLGEGRAISDQLAAMRLRVTVPAIGSLSILRGHRIEIGRPGGIGVVALGGMQLRHGILDEQHAVRAMSDDLFADEACPSGKALPEGVR